MGKPKGNKHRGGGKASKGGAVSSSQYKLEDILQKAEECMDEYKYELAQKFCERALEMDSDNVKALELTASLLLEMGQIEGAQQCLGRAIHLDPDQGHSKYLTLAQLMSGPESRDLYRKGIEIIQQSLSSTSDTDDSTRVLELRRDLSNSFVSISEIYMTDLCDEAEAQTQAKQCVDLSIESDSTNPEAFQASANYLLVTGDTDLAKECINKSIELWLPQHLKFLENGEGTETSLSYTFRLSTAKILLDLEDYEEAVKVLDSLIEEDEEVVSTWYLLGWLNYLRSRTEPEYLGNARFYLNKARQVNTVAPTDDEEMVEHIAELIKEIGEVQDNVGVERVDITEAEPDEVAELLDQEATGGTDQGVEQMED